ncbi:MAG: energy-coupling factor transporter transmembrane component T family protein [Desulfitobacteriaceae bacterium]
MADERKNKMMKTIIGYVPYESPIYSFHPLTRLIFFIISGFIPIFIDLPEVNFLIIVFLILLFAYSKVDVLKLKMYMPMMATVGVFIFLTYWLAPGNDPSNQVMGYLLGKPLYYQPLRWALVSYIRILSLLFASIFYFSTNRERDILAGFRAAKMPFIASYFIGLSLRSAGMFIEDLHTIREAEQARGLDSSVMTLSGKLKHYSMYMIPLFTLALRRGDEISNALFAKGLSLRHQGKREDYALSKFSFSVKDYAVITILVVLLVGVLSLKLRYNLFLVDNSVVNQFFLKFVK